MRQENRARSLLLKYGATISQTCRLPKPDGLHLEMSRTIFYAWQSDTEESVNHHFIAKALQAAIAHLNSDLEIQESVEGKCHSGTTVFGGVLWVM